MTKQQGLSKNDEIRKKLHGFYRFGFFIKQTVNKRLLNFKKCISDQILPCVVEVIISN